MHIGRRIIFYYCRLLKTINVFDNLQKQYLIVNILSSSARLLKLTNQTWFSIKPYLTDTTQTSNLKSFETLLTN